MNEPLRFSADEMLGSLARWLRIMGYDTRYFKNTADNDILEISRIEGRILLTRDRELAERGGNDAVLIESDNVTDQLKQISKIYSLHMNEESTRCTLCNAPLIPVTQEEVRGSVPPGALINNDQFFRCEGCGKIYWKGSHWINIMARLREIDDQRR